MKSSGGLGELSSTPGQEDASSRFAKKHAVGQERYESDDRLDPEHPPVVELLTDPSVEARTDRLSTKYEEAAVAGRSKTNGVSWIEKKKDRRVQTHE